MTRASTRGGRLHPEITTLEFALSHTQNHRASQRKQVADSTSHVIRTAHQQAAAAAQQQQQHQQQQ